MIVPCVNVCLTRVFKNACFTHVAHFPVYLWTNFVKHRIRRIKHSVNTRSESIFRDPDIVNELSRLHENFVIHVVPVDKASNYYTFVCKKHYVDILIKEL